MADTVDVMHAINKDYEREEAEANKPKPVKKGEQQYNVMWQNLQYMEEQTTKIEKEEKKFIKPVIIKKPVITEKEIEEKIDPNFDDDSLTIYGALLTDQLDQGAPGEEVAAPKIEVDTKEDLERQRKIKEKAEELLEDVAMTDEQEKQALVQEWT